MYAFVLFVFKAVFSIAYQRYHRRNHIETFAQQTTQRKVEHVVHYPRRRHVDNLRIPNVLAVALPHKDAHQHKRRIWHGGEEYLESIPLQHAQRKHKTAGIQNFRNHQFPGFTCVFREQGASHEIRQVKQSARYGTDKQKIHEKQKTAHALQNEKVLILLSLERTHNNNQAENAKPLRDYLFHTQNNPFCYMP